MSKVKIYKCRTCDHFHCENPDKNTFVYNGVQYLVYREHRSSIRLVHEQFKQKMRNLKNGNASAQSGASDSQQMHSVNRSMQQVLRSNSLMGGIQTDRPGEQVPQPAQRRLIQHPLPIVQSRNTITGTNSQLSELPSRTLPVGPEGQKPTLPSKIPANWSEQSPPRPGQQTNPQQGFAQQQPSITSPFQFNTPTFTDASKRNSGPNILISDEQETGIGSMMTGVHSPNVPPGTKFVTTPSTVEVKGPIEIGYDDWSQSEQKNAGSARNRQQKRPSTNVGPFKQQPEPKQINLSSNGATQIPSTETTPRTIGSDARQFNFPPSNTQEEITYEPGPNGQTVPQKRPSLPNQPINQPGNYPGPQFPQPGLERNKFSQQFSQRFTEIQGSNASSSQFSTNQLEASKLQFQPNLTNPFTFPENVPKNKQQTNAISTITYEPIQYPQRPPADPWTLESDQTFNKDHFMNELSSLNLPKPLNPQNSRNPQIPHGTQVMSYEQIQFSKQPPTDPWTLESQKNFNKDHFMNQLSSLNLAKPPSSSFSSDFTRRPGSTHSEIPGQNTRPQSKYPQKPHPSSDLTTMNLTSFQQDSSHNISSLTSHSQQQHQQILQNQQTSLLPSLPPRPKGPSTLTFQQPSPGKSSEIQKTEIFFNSFPKFDSTSNLPSGEVGNIGPMPPAFNPATYGTDGKIFYPSQQETIFYSQPIENYTKTSTTTITTKFPDFNKMGPAQYGGVKSEVQPTRPGQGLHSLGQKNMQTTIKTPPNIASKSPGRENQSNLSNLFSGDDFPETGQVLQYNYSSQNLPSRGSSSISFYPPHPQKSNISGLPAQVQHIQGVSVLEQTTGRLPHLRPMTPLVDMKLSPVSEQYSQDQSRGYVDQSRKVVSGLEQDDRFRLVGDKQVQGEVHLGSTIQQNTNYSSEQQYGTWNPTDNYRISLSGMRRRQKSIGNFGIGGFGASGKDLTLRHDNSSSQFSNQKLTTFYKDTPMTRPRTAYHQSMRNLHRVTNCTLDDNRCFGLNCLQPAAPTHELILDDLGHKKKSIYK